MCADLPKPLTLHGVIHTVQLHERKEKNRKDYTFWHEVQRENWYYIARAAQTQLHAAVHDLVNAKSL